MALAISPTSRRTFSRMADDLSRVLGSRLTAHVATGPASSVAFASSIEAGDLDALAALSETWQHDGLEVPLLLTADEFRRSLDVFPLEYQALIHDHVVIAGTPPFAGLGVNDDALRHACEVAAKGHLVHVRQGWLAAAGHDARLAQVLVDAAAPLRSLLTNVARLDGGSESSGDLPLAGARAAALDLDLVRDVLALEAAPGRAAHLIARLPDYLALSIALWTFVDEWQR